jgi:predicted CXXCH cytochrome family protein
MIGLSPNSSCGKMFGFSMEERRKTTTETVVSQKYRSLMRAGLKKSQKELCTGCHKNLRADMELSFPHEPFYEGKCSSCHDPHASNYPARTKAPENELCLFCHNMESDFTKAVQHSPFGIKSCLSCHNPHASDFEGIVLDTQEVLCLSCHPTVAGDISRAVRHKPFDEGICTDCHFPHSSNVSALLHEQVPYLCYSCHPDIRLDFLKVSRHPVDVTWTCLECHAPHAADYSALVNAKNNDLCFGCHSQQITLYSNRSTYNASAHVSAVRVGKGLCINCHTPHGSDYPPLEVMPEDELCHLCHERLIYDRGSTERTHPVWEPYLDERIGYKEQLKYGSNGGEVYTYTEVANPNSSKKTLRCSSTCHDPHGTGNYAMLRWVKDGLCLTCHQVEEIP